jgi:hypothetical protein
MSRAEEPAGDEESLLPLPRYGSRAHPATYYRPPFTRIPLLDYWLFHGNAEVPQVAIVRGDDRLGYRFGLCWLLTAALQERTRVGAITIDGAWCDPARDVETWTRSVTDIPGIEAEPEDLRLMLEHFDEQLARSAWQRFLRLYREDPLHLRRDAAADQCARWDHHRMVQRARRYRARRAIPPSAPTIRSVSLSAIELLNEPWRRGREWGEQISRPLMLLIATESRDQERLRVLREHARWMARFTEGFVALCEPESADHVQEVAREDEIHIRISRNLPSWLPESEKSGEPFALHARYGGNPRPTFAMKIVDVGDGVFA